MKKLRPDVSNALNAVAAFRTGENSIKAVKGAVSRALEIVRDKKLGGKCLEPWAPVNLMGFSNGITRVYGTSKLYAPRPEMADTVNAVRTVSGLPSIKPADLALRFSRNVDKKDLADLSKRVELTEAQLMAGLAKKGLIAVDSDVSIRISAKNFSLTEDQIKRAKTSIESALDSNVGARRKDRNETMTPSFD